MASRLAYILLRCYLHQVPRRPDTIEYQRHETDKTLLHQVIRDQLERFLVNARQQDVPIARLVEREFRAYLQCGVLAHGFVRLHCSGCGHDRALAFSCRGRGVCPSCAGRRMTDTTAHLVDRVIPMVPIRQWVLTLPFPLRYRMAWDARLTTEVLRCSLSAASVCSRIATGLDAGQPWRRFGDRVVPMERGEQMTNERGTQVPDRCVREGGMSLHRAIARTRGITFPRKSLNSPRRGASLAPSLI